jgi:predicted RNase H-like nuclease (RuvC/YqgF family)
VASSSDELIELQRKAIYLQRLEFESLLLKHEALQRNFDTISNAMAKERTEKIELVDQNKELKSLSETLGKQIENLKETLKCLGFGNFETKRDQEIKEMKEIVENRRIQIDHLKHTISKKIKRIDELETKLDGLEKEKDKVIATLDSDLKAN